jgi:CheY-like chemotaxis protein
MKSDFFGLGTARSGGGFLSRFRPRDKRRTQLAPQERPIVLEPTVAHCGKKILIIDDDPVIHRTVGAELVAHGYAVYVACDASEAIAAVRDHAPDLILLDLYFPPDPSLGGGWDGLQTIQWLRGLKEGGRVPFVIITGCDMEVYRTRAATSGALAWFSKPIDHPTLLALIKRVLGEAAGS